MNTSTDAFQHYSVIIDETSGHKIVQCKQCDYKCNATITTGRQRRSIHSWYYHHHYNKQHIQPNNSSQPNKRFKGSVDEVGNDPDNHEKDRLDDHPDDEDMGDWDFEVDPVNNDNIIDFGFSNTFGDDMSIESLLSTKSSSSSSLSSSGEELIEEWVSSDNFERQCSTSVYSLQECNFFGVREDRENNTKKNVYSLQEFDLFRVGEDRENNAKKNFYCHNQLYMWQKHTHKRKNKKDGTGGWRGLALKIIR